MNSCPPGPLTAGMGWAARKSLCSEDLSEARCFFLSCTSIMPTVSWVGCRSLIADSCIAAIVGLLVAGGLPDRLVSRPPTVRRSIAHPRWRQGHEATGRAPTFIVTTTIRQYGRRANIQFAPLWALRLPL